VAQFAQPFLLPFGAVSFAFSLALFIYWISMSSIARASHAPTLTERPDEAEFSPRPYEVWSNNGQFAVSLDADPILGALDFRAESADAFSQAVAFSRPCSERSAALGSIDALLATPWGRLAFLALPQAVAEQWRSTGLLVVEFDDQGPLREHYFAGPPEPYISPAS